jgi:protein arginine N-methyltransferase 5
MLSTHPATHTPDMSSWFPIYFPLKEPCRLGPGQAVQVAMWRCAAPHKVWYEWAVTQPAASHVHNVSGRSYYVGL